MNASFGLAVVLYCLGVGALCAVPAVAGRPRSGLAVPALVAVELLALVQAALDGAQVLRGRHGGDLATHVGYLVASVALLPAAVGAVRLEDSRWGNAALAIGCVVLAVVSLRLHQTLGAPAAR